MAGVNSDSNLERTSSQLSTASRKSGTLRAGSRKHSLVTPASAKTLESFPSLSPDASPGTKPDRQLTARSTPQTPRETSHRSSKQSPSIVESLITSTPSFRGRSALFDDSPKSTAKDVPGALHHSSDADIRHLIKKNGAVTLVRQLAEDLAQRDAEITVFRRRAEARERELKRMLKEVEVSNRDIETRLHRIENPNDSTITLQGPAFRGDVKVAGRRDSKDRISGVTTGIDAMVGEAMKDNVGRLSDELDEGYFDPFSQPGKQATVKARSMVSKDSDGKSTPSSIDSQGQPGSTVRGWKNYLWSGNSTNHRTSRASSVVSDYNEDVGTAIRARGGSNGRRKGLDDDLFQPPSRAATMESSTADRSRKSSTSVASWTMKLFAGNPQATRDYNNQGTVRGRSSTTESKQSKASRPTSTVDVPPIPSSAKAALMKVNSMEPSTRASRKAVQPLTIGPNGLSKTVSQPSHSQMPTSPTSVDAATNLGPVEMDTIHPPDSKPPTLMHSNNQNDGSSNLLTDRYGFIYDQRRRKKEAEATKGHSRGKSNASANVEMIGGVRDSLRVADTDRASVHSKTNSIHRPDTPASTDDRAEGRPSKRWQDYLKVTTFPAELLSHTPKPKSVTNVISSDIQTPSPSPRLKRLPTGNDSRGSLPSSHNPEPEMSPITAGNAEIAQATLNPNSAQATSTHVEGEPVKLLLAQMTELHDMLQREKTPKWNEFLRKVRAERKKEGETATSTKQATMPEVALTDGEVIGVAGLGNKGKVGQAKWKEFKNLVLGGIPVSLRAKVWAECSGASALKVPGYYEDLVNNDAIDDPSIVSQIQMDIHRTLTDNVFFRKGPGVAKLNEVLLAYSRRNPEVGYCQGMNMITASLLLIVPTAEDAFWVLTSMIENILPRHYYDLSLLASRADQQVLRQYVSEILPKLSAHLDELGIELEALTFQWFLSVFTDCLSAEALFRVWDVVLCFNDGSTFLFQVALALLKLNEELLLSCDSAASVYGYIGNEMTDHAISIDNLISASDALKKIVRRNEVEDRRYKAVEEERGREKGRQRGNSGGTSNSATSGGELSLQEPRPVGDEVDAGGRG